MGLKKFQFFECRHLMINRRKRVLYIEKNYQAIAWGLSYLLSPKKVPYCPQWRENCHYSRVIFGPKFPTLKCLNFVILKALTYMSVFSSASTIKIYQSRTCIISGIRPPGLRSYLAKLYKKCSRIGWDCKRTMIDRLISLIKYIWDLYFDVNPNEEPWTSSSELSRLLLTLLEWIGGQEKRWWWQRGSFPF